MPINRSEIITTYAQQYVEYHVAKKLALSLSHMPYSNFDDDVGGGAIVVSCSNMTNVQACPLITKKANCQVSITSD